MPLVPTAELVSNAAARGRGVAAFNVLTLEHVEAVIAGASAARAPVILQVSENAVAFRGGRMAPLVAACVAAAGEAELPVALHLDHVRDLRLLDQMSPDSFSSLMIDASHLPYDDNVTQTRGVVAWAHGRGLWVEAELGMVGGKGGQPPLDAHQPGARTDPREAALFVKATGVDALAVAVGSSHAMRSRTADLDLELIARLRAALGVPLVLHGSSGVPATTLGAAVAAGVVKVNVGTALNVAFTEAVRAGLLVDSRALDPRPYLTGAREAMTTAVADVIGSLTPQVPPSRH